MAMAVVAVVSVVQKIIDVASEEVLPDEGGRAQTARVVSGDSGGGT
ncbi:hypothetical protein IPG36_06705 [bacterium]|nr:MAG: hypothetical protein IPG36_06705 [bacterium]